MELKSPLIGIFRRKYGKVTSAIAIVPTDPHGITSVEAIWQIPRPAVTPAR